MSVLVRGMNMPKTCNECRFAYRGACIANIGREVKVDQICPLVEIPTPHGRLIDADAYGHIIGQFSLVWEYGEGVSDCWDALLAAPTIIQEEEGE